MLCNHHQMVLPSPRPARGLQHMSHRAANGFLLPGYHIRKVGTAGDVYLNGHRVAILSYAFGAWRCDSFGSETIACGKTPEAAVNLWAVYHIPVRRF